MNSTSGYYFFFAGKTYNGAFRRVFRGHQDLAPLYVLPQTKKLISRTFKIRGALVFLCPKERGGEGERGERREERGERGEERRERREERRETKGRENKSTGDYISKPPGPK